MNFLAPWYVPVLATALAVPPLLLLYFLKLKRRQVPIASTLLWQQAMQDLQVNSPFQKLRNNLLLILQLLILLAAILAICEPMWAGREDIEKNVVLMIDKSASMATDEGHSRTRLSIAKDEAYKVIEDLSTAQRAMVIAFAERAKILVPFTDDKKALRRAVESVTQTDGRSRLSQALTLAEAHSTPTGEGLGADVETAKSQYIVFTDGRLPDAGEVVVQRGFLEVVRIGQSTENVGIVGLDVRRNYERPEHLSVLARIRNFGGQAASRDVSLFVDGELKDVRTISKLTPLDAQDQLGSVGLSAIPAEGNEAVAAFELILDSAAQLEVRLSGEDDLPTDDRAYAIVTPPRALKVLLVTPGNRYLRQLISVMPLEHHETWSPQEYEDAEDDKLIEFGRCRYDVVIFDGHSTDRLPPGNYLFFAGIPLIDDVESGRVVEQELFLDWDETHPILRHVAVEAVTVFSWLNLKLPAQAATLIEATNGPVLALLNRERNQYLICAFGLFDESRTQLNTDWVFQEGFVIFLYNALRFLAGSSTVGQLPSVIPGEAFSVAAKPGVAEVSVRRPDGGSDKVLVSRSGLATYAQTDRVGIYSISTGIAGQDVRVVNLLDQQESFIAPNEAFQIAAGEFKATQGLERVNRPLWPYLLAALGVILFVEWFVYNKRVWI